MRNINKGVEPRSLTEYRAKPDAEYDGPRFTPVKADIKEQLLKEQGHLCCYCMSRITFETMKVEHWRSQTRYPDQQLDYANLLGACMGNEGHDLHEQHCDTRKGNSDIRYNPADPSHRVEESIHYDGNGVIRSEDVRFNEELNEILQLNLWKFKENRKTIVISLFMVLDRKPGRRTKAELKRMIQKWETPDQAGHLREYCGVAVYYLRRKLRRAAGTTT